MPEFSISPYGLTITREDGTEVDLSINELAYAVEVARENEDLVSSPVEKFVSLTTGEPIAVKHSDGSLEILRPAVFGPSMTADFIEWVNAKTVWTSVRVAS